MLLTEFLQKTAARLLIDERLLNFVEKLLIFFNADKKISYLIP